MNHKSGTYETIYGNAVEYEEGDDFGFDIDMQTEVPIEMIDFNLILEQGE